LDLENLIVILLAIDTVFVDLKCPLAAVQSNGQGAKYKKRLLDENRRHCPLDPVPTPL
jgi:hypothetical protein